MKNKFILLSLIVALCGCRNTSDSHTTTFSGNGYSLQFPSNWNVHAGPDGVDVIASSPADSADRLQAGVTVIIENVPSQMSHDAYLELNLAQIIKFHELPSDSKFTPKRIGQYEGHHLLYTKRTNKNEIDVDIYIVIQNSKAFAIFCSIEHETRELFATTMSGIISTLIIE